MEEKETRKNSKTSKANKGKVINKNVNKEKEIKQKEKINEKVSNKPKKKQDILKEKDYKKSEVSLTEEEKVKNEDLSLVHESVTEDEIARIVRPIAQRYGLRAVYLFGSYARGAATEDSDIDLLIDTTGTNIKSLLQVAAVYCELEEALGKPVDLVTVSSLEQEARMPSEESFRKAVWKEKVDIYVAA